MTEKVALTPDQWRAKLQTIARNIATRQKRNAELWYYYTPEAEQLMRKTWTRDEQ